MKDILVLVALIVIILMVLYLRQTEGFEVDPTGAFNIVKGVRVTSGGTGYEIMPSFTPKATGVTFSAWFVLTGSALPADWSRIFDMGVTTPSPATAIVLAIHSGKLRCHHSVAGTDPVQLQFSGTTALALHTMYHVVWTHTLSKWGSGRNGHESPGSSGVSLFLFGKKQLDNGSVSQYDPL